MAAEFPGLLTLSDFLNLDTRDLFLWVRQARIMRSLRRLENAQTAMLPHVSNDDRKQILENLKHELENESWDDGDLAQLDQENEQRRRELEALMAHRKKKKKPVQGKRSQLITSV